MPARARLGLGFDFGAAGDLLNERRGLNSDVVGWLLECVACNTMLDLPTYAELNQHHAHVPPQPDTCKHSLGAARL